MEFWHSSWKPFCHKTQWLLELCLCVRANDAETKVNISVFVRDHEAFVLSVKHWSDCLRCMRVKQGIVLISKHWCHDMRSVTRCSALSTTTHSIIESILLRLSVIQLNHSSLFQAVCQWRLNPCRYWIDWYHPGPLSQAVGSLDQQERSQLLSSFETWLILSFWVILVFCWRGRFYHQRNFVHQQLEARDPVIWNSVAIAFALMMIMMQVTMKSLCLCSSIQQRSLSSNSGHWQGFLRLPHLFFGMYFSVLTCFPQSWTNFSGCGIHSLLHCCLTPVRTWQVVT